MTGPKLDARSYAILILALLAVVLGGKLIAEDNVTGTQYQSTVELATATRDVAAATREVAAANTQIAEAIRQLATSVSDMKKSNDASGNSSSANSDSNAATIGTHNNQPAGGIQPVIVGSDSAPAAVVTPVPSKTTNAGVFEMNKAK